MSAGDWRIRAYLIQRKAALEMALAQACGRRVRRATDAPHDAVGLLLAGTAETVLARALSEVTDALAAGELPSEALLGPDVAERYRARADGIKP